MKSSNLSNLTFVSTGWDSTVYHVNQEYVLKVYDNLMAELQAGLNSEPCLNMIKQYAADTLKAAEIVENSWAKLSTHDRYFMYGPERYDIKVSIVPQGKAKVISLPILDVPPRVDVPRRRYVASVGQKYVLGPNLYEIDDWNNTGVDRNKFYEVAHSENTNIKRSMRRLNEIIVEEVKPPFSIARTNIKFVLDKPNKTLHWMITDLASSISDVYISDNHDI